MVGIKRFHSFSRYFYFFYISLAYSLRVLRGTVSSALIWVLSNLMKGAQLALNASTQRLMHKHHWSPAINPGNWYSGLGVMRSFPLCRLNSKKASVTMAHTRWLPTSSSLVLQQPSLKNPVRGSKEQGVRGSPNTLSAISFCMAALKVQYQSVYWISNKFACPKQNSGICVTLS